MGHRRAGGAKRSALSRFKPRGPRPSFTNTICHCKNFVWVRRGAGRSVRPGALALVETRQVSVLPAMRRSCMVLACIWKRSRLDQRCVQPPPLPPPLAAAAFSTPLLPAAVQAPAFAAEHGCTALVPCR